jgi:hypothetical protein
MANKTGNNKKGGFALTPITLSDPVKVTDGFTNLVETPAEEVTTKPRIQKGNGNVAAKKLEQQKQIAANQTDAPKPASSDDSKGVESVKANYSPEKKTIQAKDFSLSEGELLQILDADSLDEIYELSDVLRASSLKLYATLVRLADSRGRTRVKNHELMSKAGIKGIATLYKQERWLMDLKLLEKKAKPGPHDGSSYVVHKLETLPLPDEIYEKFDEYLSGLK